MDQAFRSLKDEINFRIINKKYFTNLEIEKMLIDCINGLFIANKKKIAHRGIHIYK